MPSDPTPTPNVTQAPCNVSSSCCQQNDWKYSKWSEGKVLETHWMDTNYVKDRIHPNLDTLCSAVHQDHIGAYACFLCPSKHSCLPISFCLSTFFYNMLHIQIVFLRLLFAFPYFSDFFSLAPCAQRVSQLLCLFWFSCISLFSS